MTSRLPGEDKWQSDRSKTGSREREFLAGYLPYLLNRLTREMLRGVDKQFQERGLTVSKWRILAVLSDRGTCRFGELARLTSIEPATLSRFVERAHPRWPDPAATILRPTPAR